MKQLWSELQKLIFSFSPEEPYDEKSEQS